MTSVVLRARDRPTWIFCPPIMIAPRTETGNSSAPPAAYRAIEIQAAPHSLTPDPLPDDLRHAVETIARTADLRTDRENQPPGAGMV